MTLVSESGGEIIGIGEYHVSPGREEAEVAFAVADAHHHEGVATVLLEDLALIGRAAGLCRLVAETLPGNTAMKSVFRSVGLVQRDWFEDGVVYVELDLTADHLLQDDADLRDWRSAVRSLQPLIEPSHVVVIGVDDDAASPAGESSPTYATRSPAGSALSFRPARSTPSTRSASSTRCRIWRSSPSRQHPWPMPSRSAAPPACARQW